MSNEGGPGCQDLAGNTLTKTVVSGKTCDTAGGIDAYRIFTPDDANPYNVEGSLQNINAGAEPDEFTYISGTETTELEDIRELTENGENCREVYEGTDFTTTTEASIGDYLSCYYQGLQELTNTGGDGTWRDSGNSCQATGWVSESRNATYDCGIGVDIAAAGTTALPLLVANGLGGNMLGGNCNLMS